MSRTAALREKLRTYINSEKAAVLPRFFKTGTGEYGEGDKFLGVVVPDIRTVVRQFRDLSLDEVEELLKSPFHEERLTSLLILVDRYKRGTHEDKNRVFDFYLSHTKYISNWDLVDLSASHIVGMHLIGGDTSVLARLAVSDSLWERRIAIIATLAFIRKGHPAEALKISRLLLHDPHDLIHKAVGWMLREVGKRCSQEIEESFLRVHYKTMPRTMLRYAIERFPEARRQRYLKGMI